MSDQMNQAESIFRSGFNCAQAVLSSFSDKFEIDNDTLLKIANGFGGGMGRKQEVCGAVSGAIMVIGLLYGRGAIDSMDNHETTYRKTRELIDSFTKEFGTINCKELLEGCNLLSEDGQKMFQEKGLKEKCCLFVKRANEITTGLIDG